MVDVNCVSKDGEAVGTHVADDVGVFKSMSSLSHDSLCVLIASIDCSTSEMAVSLHM